MSLDRPRFTTSRFVETYDMAEVDDAVDRIFAALAGPTPTLGTGDVQAMRFTPVRLREGYTMDEVDDWLDQVVAEINQRAAPAEPVAGSTPAPTAYAPTRSDAIVEVSGPSRQLPLVLLAVLVVVAVLVYVSVA